MEIRLLPDLDAAGPCQMVSDEALLAEAVVPTLRLYTWTPATVSLGYFQEYAPIAASLPPGMPIVRRITGGGAIWHEHEVTYALIGRLGSQGFPERTRDLYPLLHGAIQAHLAVAGARIGIQAETVGDRRYAQEPRCFASPAADDLVHPQGGKVLGSAARARGDRVLVHGSLKLATNSWDQEVTAGCGLTAAVVQQVLRTAIPQALGLDGVAGDWTATELVARETLRQLRYGTTAWVEKREGPRA